MARDLESHLYALLDASAKFFDEGDLGAALARAEEAYGFATQNRDRISAAALIDTLYAVADTLVETDSADEALPLYDEIERLNPEDESLALRRGIALLHLVQFDHAQHELERFPLTGECAAEALWHLAVIAEFRGREGEADELFAKAHEHAADMYPLPVRLNPRQVQALLNEVIEDLPDPVRAAIANVVIQIEPLPDPDLLREGEPPLSPFLLGLYVGTSWGEQSVFAQPADLDRILIFQKNIERIAADKEGLHDQLRITLLHEIGHHLGWDEDDLAQRGLD